jgi:hypothetical protein
VLLPQVQLDSEILNRFLLFRRLEYSLEARMGELTV